MEKRSCENCKHCKYHYTLNKHGVLVKIDCFHCVSKIKGRKINKPNICMHYEKRDEVTYYFDTIEYLSRMYNRILVNTQQVCDYLESLKHINED